MNVRVEDHGSVVLLRPLDDESKAWFGEHLPPHAPMFGDAYAVEPRYVGEILEGFDNAGGCLA